MGFYRSFDTYLPKKRGSTPDMIAKAVFTAFDIYPSATIAKLCDTKCRIMGAIIGVGGDNTFKIPRSDVLELSDDDSDE